MRAPDRLHRGTTDGASLPHANAWQAFWRRRTFAALWLPFDGVVVGLLLGQKERWVDAFRFNLQEMCVHSDRQRSGVGRALLLHMKERLREEGTDEIYLITALDSRAAAFYSANGYQPTRDRIVMAAELEKG